MNKPFFTAEPPDQLRYVTLDGLTLIYHRRSGQTHLVSEPLPDILETLGDCPMNAAQILAQLSSRATIPEAGAAEALSARLAELEAIGLVSRS